MEQITVPDKDLSDKNEDNKYEPFIFELNPDPHYKPDKVKYLSSSSTSSSSDSDEDDDFIQLDTITINNGFLNPSPNNDPSAISHKNPNPDQLLIPTLQPDFSTRPVETTNCSDMPAPQDVNRIPSSIFTTQSKAPMEWSVTSAESLFSLNFSNSSFTLENANFNGLPPDSPMPTTPGSAISVVSDLSFVGFGGPLEVLEETREGGSDEVVKENSVELGTDGGKLVDVSVANSHRSDGSASSSQSFAFPVLTGDERTESVKVEPQPDLPAPAISQSMSAKKTESEPKSEPEPELPPPSSNSDQLTQPPHPQVMAAPDKEEHLTVTDTTAATNENADTHEATKTSSTTSTGSGSFCSCCSFSS